MENYSKSANELVGRIKKLIPEHPEILQLQDCWDLFKIPGFKCDDLEPTMFQAQWALKKAQQLSAEAQNDRT